MWNRCGSLALVVILGLTVVAADVITDDLVRLFRAWNGPSWIRNDGWNTATPVCEWFGVVCESGLVTELNLDSNGLAGSLDRALGNLTSLKTISLSVNRISGSIPTEIGLLTQLERLNLYENSFSGQLPDTLNSCPELWYLNVGLNELTGTFPMIVGLSKLSRVNFNDNHISGTIPNWFGELKSLTKLVADGNNLRSTLPASVGQIPGLYFLTLSNNKLSGTLPDSLGDLGQLQILMLNGNNFTGPVLPPTFNCPLMRVLRMSNNSFYGVLPPAASELLFLQELDVSNNPLLVELEPFLRPIIWKEKNCIELTDPDKCTALNALVIDNTGIRGRISPNVLMFQQLAILSLPRNKYLSGPLPPSYATLWLINPYTSETVRWFVAVPSWVTVDLSNCPGLVGPVPDDWSRFSTMRFLDVRGTSLRAHVHCSRNSSACPPPFLRSTSEFVSYDSLNMRCATLSNAVGTLQVRSDPVYTEYTHCQCRSEYYGFDGNCTDCPYGARCQEGNIKILPGFWGDHNTYLTTGVVRLYRCPTGYCTPENSQPVSLRDACTGNRTGPLCAHCAEGYTMQFGSEACAPISGCISPVGPVIALLAVTLIFAIYLVSSAVDDFPGSPLLITAGLLKIYSYFYQTAPLIVSTVSQEAVNVALGTIYDVMDLKPTTAGGSGGVGGYHFCLVVGLDTVQKKFVALLPPLLLLVWLALLAFMLWVKNETTFLIQMRKRLKQAHVAVAHGQLENTIFGRLGGCSDDEDLETADTAEPVDTPPIPAPAALLSLPSRDRRRVPPATATARAAQDPQSAPSSNGDAAPRRPPDDSGASVSERADSPLNSDKGSQGDWGWDDGASDKDPGEANREVGARPDAGDTSRAQDAGEGKARDNHAHGNGVKNVGGSNEQAAGDQATEGGAGAKVGDGNGTADKDSGAGALAALSASLLGNVDIGGLTKGPLQTKGSRKTQRKGDGLDWDSDWVDKKSEENVHTDPVFGDLGLGSRTAGGVSQGGELPPRGAPASERSRTSPRPLPGGGGGPGIMRRRAGAGFGLVDLPKNNGGVSRQTRRGGCTVTSAEFRQRQLGLHDFPYAMHLNAFFVITSLIYSTLLKTVFDLLLCIDIDNQKFLWAQADVACYSDWQISLFIFVLLLAAWPFVLLVLTRRIARKPFEDRRGYETATYNAISLLFRDEFTWWEAMLMFRRLLCICTWTFLSNNLNWRAWTMSLWCFLFSLSNVWWRPYRSQKLHHIETTLLSFLVVLSLREIALLELSQQVVLDPERDQSGKDTHLVFSVISMLLLLIPPFFALPILYRVIRRILPEKIEAVQEVVASIKSAVKARLSPPPLEEAPSDPLAERYRGGSSGPGDLELVGVGGSLLAGPPVLRADT